MVLLAVYCVVGGRHSFYHIFQPKCKQMVNHDWQTTIMTSGKLKNYTRYYYVVGG